MSEYAHETFQQQKYQAEYNKKHYDRLELIVPKGEKEKIKKIASDLGESTNKFIYTAICERIKQI